MKPYPSTSSFSSFRVVYDADNNIRTITSLETDAIMGAPSEVYKLISVGGVHPPEHALSIDAILKYGDKYVVAQSTRFGP